MSKRKRNSMGMAAGAIVAILMAMVGFMFLALTMAGGWSPAQAALGFAGLAAGIGSVGWAMPTLRKPRGKGNRTLAWILVALTVALLVSPGLWWAMAQNEWTGLERALRYFVSFSVLLGLIVALRRWRQATR